MSNNFKRKCAHFFQRLRERNITKEEVYFCLLRGERKYVRNWRGSKAMMAIYDYKGLRVVVAENKIPVTAFRPEDN